MSVNAVVVVIIRAVVVTFCIQSYKNMSYSYLKNKHVYFGATTNIIRRCCDVSVILGRDMNVKTYNCLLTDLVWIQQFTVSFVTRQHPATSQQQTFLPHFTARRYASAVYAVVVCPPVRPSQAGIVTKHIITKISPTIQQGV